MPKMKDEKHWIDNDHYRQVSEDGSRSEVYKSNLIIRDDLVEVSDHNPDGTTDSYEADTSLYGCLVGDLKGKQKN